MKLKVGLVTLLVAIPAFLVAPAAPLGHAIWPAPAELAPPPTSTQVSLFMLLGACEALALGLGAAFLLFGWPLVRQVAAAGRGRALASYLSIGWLLVNWWAHDGFHMVNGLHPGGLLGIEYAFHVTLIVAGAALAYAFGTLAAEGSLAGATGPGR